MRPLILRIPLSDERHPYWYVSKIPESDEWGYTTKLNDSFIFDSAVYLNKVMAEHFPKPHKELEYIVMHDNRSILNDLVWL